MTMAYDIDDEAVWLSNEKATNAPRFIRERVNNLTTLCHGSSVNAVNIRYFN